MENSKGQEFLLCECSSPEHQLLMTYFNDEPDVYVTVHLNRLPFFKRLKYAIKYIFGYQSCYGAFDEFIMNKSHIDPLLRVVDNIKKAEVEKASKTINAILKDTITEEITKQINAE